MSYETILYGVDAGIAKITFNRPQVMNAFDQASLKEINAALKAAASDEAAKVVVLTGAGRAFSAGRDFTALGEERDGKDVGRPIREIVDTIQSLPKVVIAMVNGYCLTGALEIVVACDIIIASEEAKFAETHVRYGLRPAAGLSQRLPLLVGLMKAKELCFTAKMITAEEAERIGLVNMAVPVNKLEETVKQMAEQIMANSLDAVAVYKQLFNTGDRAMIEKGLDFEIKGNFVIRDTEERLRKALKKG